MGVPTCMVKIKTVVLIQPSELHPLLQLPLAMSSEDTYCLRRKPDTPASSLSLGLGEAMAATFASEGTPHSLRQRGLHRGSGLITHTGQDMAVAV